MKVKKILKTASLVLLFLFGIYTLGFWSAGSHGHLQFDPWMMEDWIMGAIVVVCFGVPLFFLMKRILRKSR